MLFRTVLVAFTLVLTLSCASCWKVWLYDLSEHAGQYLELSGETCQNIPDSHKLKTSSINTHEGCLRLYTKKNCKGRSLEMSPLSGAHNRLALVDFNNMAVSVGPCDVLVPTGDGPKDDGTKDGV